MTLATNELIEMPDLDEKTQWVIDEAIAACHEEVELMTRHHGKKVSLGGGNHQSNQQQIIQRVWISTAEKIIETVAPRETYGTIRSAHEELDKALEILKSKLLDVLTIRVERHFNANPQTWRDLIDGLNSYFERSRAPLKSDLDLELAKTRRTLIDPKVGIGPVRVDHQVAFAQVRRLWQKLTSKTGS